ncbi:MAG: RNA polymerase sigma factor [Pirellulaceae bacterium]
MTVDFGEHSRSLWRFALSLTGCHATAEDLVQETMLRAVKQQQQLSDVENTRAWLFTVAANLWRDQCRQQQRRPPSQPLHLVAEPATRDWAETENREHLTRVMESFQELPELQRKVLYLRTVEQFSIAEIAEIAETTINSVKVSLSLARKRLRQKFERPQQKENQELQS